MNVNDIAKAVLKATSAKKETSPYYASARVTRVDQDGTAWVHIDGGVSETPAEMTMSAKAGDTVKIRVAGGRAWITGNVTSPPTDDSTARRAVSIGTNAQSTADGASQEASSAKSAAESAQASAAIANENALAAQSSANEAAEAAANAQSSANTADSNAKDAITSATAAAAAAQTAQDAAEAAVSTANDASSTANGVKQRADNREFDAAVMYIHSSEGTAFKNDMVSTVLTVVIYHGNVTVTDQASLEAEFGSGAYLQWKCRLYGSSDFSTILSTDTRITDNGFTFTISPDDVDTQAVFNCELITS